MWFGTVDGLNRYDGYEVSIFKTNKDDVVDFLIFTDDRGYLSSIEITYGFGTHAPIPNGIELHECVHSQFN